MYDVRSTEPNFNYYGIETLIEAQKLAVKCYLNRTDFHTIIGIFDTRHEITECFRIFQTVI